MYDSNDSHRGDTFCSGGIFPAEDCGSHLTEQDACAPSFNSIYIIDPGGIIPGDFTAEGKVYAVSDPADPAGRQAD